MGILIFFFIVFIVGVGLFAGSVFALFAPATEKDCAECGETIKIKARKCVHCGARQPLDEADQPTSAPASVQLPLFSDASTGRAELIEVKKNELRAKSVAFRSRARAITRYVLLAFGMWYLFARAGAPNSLTDIVAFVGVGVLCGWGGGALGNIIADFNDDKLRAELPKFEATLKDHPRRDV